ncbi:MAG: hypothetical protein K6G23_00445 [Lachnospiraceae bacterium]|nr:hypothetical protein [Lachnospiraceae bacterium]
MKSTVYSNYKYMLQDVQNVYIGAKFTYDEIIENDDLNFKFRSIVMAYLMKETEKETTLESDFYYMDPQSFTYKTYEQLRTKVKYSELVTKKHLFGKEEQIYEERIDKLRDFAAIPLEEKKQRGIVVQEIILSKLALLGFAL